MNHTRPDLQSALSCESVMVTPQMARTLRATCHFERQRPIKQDHVDRLKAEMAKGWFLAGTPLWFCRLPDGKELLINGNHTLEAIGGGEISVPLVLIHQKVPDIEAACWAYTSFDVQRTRSYLHAAQAFGLNESVPYLSPALSACAYIGGDFAANPWSSHNDASRSRRRRIDLVKEYHPALAMLKAIMTDSPKVQQALMKRGPTLACAMATLRYQPSTAEAFWTGIVWDDGLRVGDPRHTLLRFLRSADVRRNQEGILWNTSLAWNAWFSNQKLDRFTRRPEAAVIELSGTPWAKRSSKKVVQLRRQKAA